jgi:HSP20 family protein
MFPIEQSFNKFFDDFFGSNPLSKVKASSGYPRMNVYEANDKFVVTLSVPGMKDDDLDVEIDSNRTLSVRGRKSESYQAPEGAGYYLKELHQSSFERSVHLPDHVHGDPRASMKDGMLELTWDTEKKKPEGIRKISIKNIGSDDS